MPTLLPSRRFLTGRNNTDLGTLTHALVGSHIQFTQQSAQQLTKQPFGQPTRHITRHPETATGSGCASSNVLADRRADVGASVDDVHDGASLNPLAGPGLERSSGAPSGRSTDHPDSRSSNGYGSPRLPADLLERMYAVAYAVIDANPNATRVLATEASSLAYRYLTEFPPGPPWRLLGVEHDTGEGKVDLAWVHTTTQEVFYDELKTSRVSNGRRLPPNWVAQAQRYAAAGYARHREAFLGTRLVPLMAADTVRLFAHRQPPRLLAPTPCEPLRVACRRPSGGSQ